MAPQGLTLPSSRVVVVGVVGRYGFDDADRAVLSQHLGDAQVAAVSVRPRYVGDCATAGWATLGAGRRAGVGAECDPLVQGRYVVGWDRLQAAAAARSGDARLGTLAASVTGCVAAVGPGAAVAAARPDGSLAAYDTVERFVAGGAKLRCPITLIDAGAVSDQLVSTLSRQTDVSVLVTGIGPARGSHDPGLQVLYRLGASPPGLLTSTSTRRTGIVTLADLTRTLVDFGTRTGPGAASNGSTLAVDGAPLQVEPAALTVTMVEQRLAAVRALSDAAVTGYLALGAGGVVLFLLMVGSLLTERLGGARLFFALGPVMGAAMLLTGAVPWSRSSSPGLAISLTVAGWSVVLTAAVFLLARRLRIPVAVAGAALTVTALTVDAALGGVMQPGSMLNSRPVAGGRWYGFGNVTFSVYAGAGLVLAGYLAHRLRRTGHSLAAVVAVAVIGFGVIVCEGWPTMGADFGGVLALTPGVLWLVLMLSGVRITWAKVLAISVGAVLAISLISYLDWRRGPTARSHLGNFVQRVIDGDALDVVVRKGAASWETIISPLGISYLVLGIPLWLLMFRYLLPVLAADFSTIRTVAVAVLGTAILGTLLNDGGINVWLTVSSLFVVMIGSLWVERSPAGGRLTWAGRRSR